MNTNIGLDAVDLQLQRSWIDRKKEPNGKDFPNTASGRKAFERAKQIYKQRRIDQLRIGKTRSDPKHLGKEHDQILSDIEYFGGNRRELWIPLTKGKPITINLENGGTRTITPDHPEYKNYLSGKLKINRKFELPGEDRTPITVNYEEGGQTIIYPEHPDYLAYKDGTKPLPTKFNLVGEGKGIENLSAEQVEERKKAAKRKDPADLKTDIFTIDPRTGKEVGVLTRNQRRAFEKSLRINKQKPKRAPGLYLTRT
tara:strand:+ start:809 stop:1573 length:765 start_codon:yes stop_codon:yes gene_type:complete